MSATAIRFGFCKKPFNSIKNELVKLHPLFLEDIQKYVPGLWERLEAFRGRQLLFIEELLEHAKQAGLIRDVNTRLVTVIMLENMQTLIRLDFAARHGVTVMDVADTLFNLFIEGLRTDRKQ